MLTLLKTKLMLVALGAAVLLGGGAAAMAATQSAGNQPDAAVAGSLAVSVSPTTSTKSAEHQSQNPSQPDQTDVSIEGVLTTVGVSTTAAAKGTGTVAVQERGKNTVTQVSVNADTRVNGWHAQSVVDLAAVKGQQVQVQAKKQQDGTLAAWKITVQGPTGTPGQPQENTQSASQTSGNGQDHAPGSTKGPGHGQGAAPASSVPAQHDQSGQHGHSGSPMDRSTPTSTTTSNS